LPQGIIAHTDLIDWKGDFGFRGLTGFFGWEQNGQNVEANPHPVREMRVGFGV
jgi:hypothetical protein